MKTLLSLVLGLLFVQTSHADLQCMTSEGIRFSIIEDYSREKECEINIIKIGGKQVPTKDADGCSILASFTGADGSKISLSANGVGNYVYNVGKVVGVNCDREKK